MFSTRLKNFLPISSNLNCCLQILSFWKSLKSVIWERVDLTHTKIFFHNRLSDNKTLVLSELRAFADNRSSVGHPFTKQHFADEFADDNLKFDKHGEKFYKRVRNTGKRRNCSLKAIFHFPMVFSKGLYCRHVKTRACLVQSFFNRLRKSIFSFFHNVFKRPLSEGH